VQIYPLSLVEQNGTTNVISISESQEHPGGKKHLSRKQALMLRLAKSSILSQVYPPPSSMKIDEGATKTHGVDIQ
jgi:hypothetical protein